MGRTKTTKRPYRLMLGAGGVSLVGAVLLAIFYAGEPAAQLRDPSPKPVAPASVPAAPAAVGDTPSVLKSGLVSKWESYTTRDGLPSDKAFAIRVDGDRVWVGTTRGLALFENGTWHRYGTEDGLPHPVILSLDVSPRTGDLWIGTMGGLARFSAGRFDVYSQLHSGLPNDFVNSVRCDPDEDTVWVATAMGAGRLNLRTDSWSIYTHANTPMHEPWTYSVTLGEGAVYIGAWGAGILEFTKETGRWREYRDPDKEFEIDLFRDDGPVSDITASVDFASGLLWQATYTGAARYDGREWRSFLDDDSGLAGNFINFVHAEGSRAWFATDQGVSFTDGEDWVTYRRREDGRGEMVGFRDGEKLAPRVTSTALAHNYVLGVDTTEDEVWLATGQGVSRGFRSKGSMNSLLHGLEVVEVAEMIGSPGDGRFRYARTPDALLPYQHLDPHKEFFTEPTPFRGPGREDPPPQGVGKVSIGFIGPLEDRDNPSLDRGTKSGVRNNPKAVFGRRMLRAATLAIREANEGGGFQGIPFQLIPRTDLVLWGQTSNELVQFAEKDRVWAVLSSIDSNHSHVLSRATIKVEMPILSAGSSDPSLVEHSVPWLVRVMNDDRQQAYVLLNQIFRIRGHDQVALLRVNDRDGRLGVVEFIQGARRLGHPVRIELRFENGDLDFRDQLERIRDIEPDALVLWGNPSEAARVVRQARELGMEIPIYGFDRLVQNEFLEVAGEAAEGILMTATLNPDRKDPDWQRFRERYQTRWGEDPDTFAAHAYDGMKILIQAVRKAGLNRIRIRDALFEMKTYHGVTGEIIFDTNLNNVSPPWMAEVRNGRFHYSTAPSWPEQSPDPPNESSGSGP